MSPPVPPVPTLYRSATSPVVIRPAIEYFSHPTRTRPLSEQSIPQERRERRSQLSNDQTSRQTASTGVGSEKRRSNRLSTLSALSVRQDWTQEEAPSLSQVWTVDQDNPRNWTTAQKLFQTTLHVSNILTCTLTGTILEPARQNLVDHFRISYLVSILPFSFYLLGLAVGFPLIGFSERFGRKVTLLACFTIFSLLVLGSGYAHSIAVLVSCRFLAGLFASLCLNISASAITDIWPTRVLAVAINVCTQLLGPITGIVVGPFVAQSKGWRWTMWTVLFACALELFLIMASLQSHKRTVLRRRKSHLRQNDTTNHEDHEEYKFPQASFLVAPSNFLLSLHTAIITSVLYLSFVTFPNILSSTYDTNVHGRRGLPFVATAIGIVVALVLVGLNHAYIQQPRQDRAQSAREQRKEEAERQSRSRRRISYKGQVSFTSRAISASSSGRSLTSKKKSRSSDFAGVVVSPSENTLRAATSASNYLNGLSFNEGRNILPERIILILHANHSFRNVCNAIHALGLSFETMVLAKVLVDALPADSERDDRPSFARSKSLHREAAVAAFSGTALPAPPVSPVPKLDSSAQSQIKYTPPNWHLLLALPASIVLPGSLFLFAWTTRASVHWVVPMIGLGLFGASSLLILVAETTYIICSERPEVSGLLTAGIGALQYLLAFAFSMFALTLYEALGVAWATSALALLCLVFGAVPWVVYFRGGGSEADS